jgi:hypothetical protein
MVFFNRVWALKLGEDWSKKENKKQSQYNFD